MAIHPLAGVLQQLRRLVAPTATGDQADDALLDRFVEQHDESAFAALFGRYGPLVLRVCRQVLHHEQDAEDAFQATFLVLARKAASVRHGQALPAWLHRVAYHVAVHARTRAGRRRTQQEQEEIMHADPRLQQVEWRELGPVLHQEVNRLPRKYRQPIVLCYLDGRTHEQAADQLGWPVGTVRTRLSRGRDLLQTRLVRRGVAPALGTIAALLGEGSAPAAVRPELTASTLKAVLLVAAGEAAATSGLSTTVVALMEGALRTMFLSRLQVALGLVLLLLLVSGMAGMFWPRSQAAPVRQPVDPAQVKTDQPAVVQGNTAFALDLYGRLRSEPGNLFISPYSVSTALAMTYAGARDDTAAQMAKTLHFPLEGDRLHAVFGSLIQATRSDPARKDYQLNVANALWCQSGYAFLDDFLSLNESAYGARPFGVDFVSRTEEARRTINDWVEKQTQDKIKDLLQKDDVKPDTRLVLTNAIYFKGTWAVQFKEKDTESASFHLAAKETVKVPLMSLTGKFKYYDGGTFRALELPYAGKDLSMVVFLPKQVDGLADLEAALTPANLSKWLAAMHEETLPVHLPKFKTQWRENLVPQLVSLGMSDACSRRADFSGINGKRELFIHKVIHQSFIEVNEQGSEAAAATAVIMGRGGPPVARPFFRADHPFLFVIRDQRNGSILFLGRIVDPRS